MKIAGLRLVALLVFVASLAGCGRQPAGRPSAGTDGAPAGRLTEGIRGPDMARTATVEESPRVIWDGLRLDFRTEGEAESPQAVVVSLDGEVDGLAGEAGPPLAVRAWAVDFGPDTATADCPPDPTDADNWVESGTFGGSWRHVSRRARGASARMARGLDGELRLAKTDDRGLALDVRPYFAADTTHAPAGEYRGELLFEVEDSAGNALPFHYRGEGHYIADADGWSAGTMVLSCPISLSLSRSQPPEPEPTPLTEQPVPGTFAGRSWHAKEAESAAPEANAWSAENVVIDERGLHLRLTVESGAPVCAETMLQEPLGYGRYTWKLEGDLAGMDAHAVGAAFIYANDSEEVDAIEISSWGDPDATERFQHVLQPAAQDSTHRFPCTANRITVTLIWEPGKATLKTHDGDTGKPVSTWTYTGAKVPPSTGRERVRMNLWATKQGEGQLQEGAEILFTDFRFQAAPQRLAFTAPDEGVQTGSSLQVKGVGTPATKVTVDVLPADDDWYPQGTVTVSGEGEWACPCHIGNEETKAGHQFTIRARSNTGEVATRRVRRR